MSQVHVDHIIYAVDDLKAAGRQLYEEFCLASIEGGRPRAWGTANRIVPLGTAYLELITVFDRDVAAFSDFGRPGDRRDRRPSASGRMGRRDGRPRSYFAALGARRLTWSAHQA
jgi:Glyoxalase-like domain